MDEEQQEIEPSLDALKQAFAEALGRSGPTEEQNDAAKEQHPANAETGQHRGSQIEPATQIDACPISPQSILEAILFVGHPENEPVAAAKIASLLRGVDVEELDELVKDLNQQYEQQQMPVAIKSVGGGYQMELRPELAHVRERFYGRVRHAKLSQLAVDVLAVVAYNQPVTREEVDALINSSQPSSRVLNQLIRRDLVARRTAEGTPKRKEYVTTDRFLDLFHLSRLSDLPRSEDPG